MTEYSVVTEYKDRGCHASPTLLYRLSPQNETHQSVVTSSRDSDTDRHRERIIFCRKSFTYFITRFRAPRREGGRLCVYIVLTQFQLPFVVTPSFLAARPVPFLRTLSLACSCGRGPWRPRRMRPPQSTHKSNPQSSSTQDGLRPSRTVLCTLCRVSSRTLCLCVTGLRRRSARGGAAQLS